MAEYNPIKIEQNWQKVWEETRLFQGTVGSTVKDKLYLLFAFAYPSGSGLHVGHVESKTALDILARYNRMNGKDVFFPVGWDAFGLPAENYAIKTGVHPSETTKKAINTFRTQIKRIGISYDWDSEIATSHPEYYRWTQWIFLKLFEKGLAYKKPGMVNWCPSCQTVLANEQVVSGECERCGSKVVQKSLEQWYFRITDYKDELIEGLDKVDWPKPTEDQQVNWIGRSEGHHVKFKIQNDKFQKETEVFTTRLDTIFGVSFLVVAPEVIASWVGDGLELSPEVSNYIEQTKGKTEEDRRIGEKDKTGVDTGLTAINPVNKKEVPVYVADYVLAGYGTGVVMGVPAHDGRDGGFADKFGLEKISVVMPDVKIDGEWKVVDEEVNKQILDGKLVTNVYGRLVNSGEFNDTESQEAMKLITSKFSDSVKVTVNYKLRDWLISRQRYWGAPIPVVYDPDGVAHPVSEEHLPWELPVDVEFKPTGESPLRGSKELKERVERLYGTGWTPEYDTMDTFVDSSWYFLRYPTKTKNEELRTKNLKPKKSAMELPFDTELNKKWLPVDFYMIGPEHIVLHLLYARFFTKFLRDCGYLEFDEPFMKMRHQGMILGPDHKKMSKSKGNVIDPDEVISKFGADTLRVYEMFMGPIEADKPWEPRSVVGIYRFLSKIYTLTISAIEEHKSQIQSTKSQTNLGNDQNLKRVLHKTIKVVGEDIVNLKFNTAIARMMEFVNEWQKIGNNKKEVMSNADLESFIKILAPFAPFLAEELWQKIGNNEKEVMSNDKQQFVSVHMQPWPVWNPEMITEQSVIVAVQVNGKLRGQVEVASDKVADRDFVLSLARKNENVAKWLVGDVKKEVFIPGKLVNFVVV